MLGLVSRLFVLATVIVGSYGDIDLSKYLKVCDRSSLDLNDCMVDAVQEGMEKMSNGIEELGVPPVDPFHQKELKVEYKNNQISAKMFMKNIYVYGLKGAKVHDARVRADDDRLKIEVDLSAPEVFIKGQYQGEGQYNALKINARGSFNTTMSDLVWTWKIDGVPEKNGSDTFIRVNSFYMRPDVGNMVSYLFNDNPDTKELTDLGTRFTNENWRILYKELLPYAQSNWNKIGTRVANKIFLKVPYNQVFPTGS